MSSTRWNVGVSGNWATAGNWSAGIPNSGTDVTINAFGTYSVALTTVATASSLTLDASGAVLSQASGTALAVSDAFDLESGKAILRGNNDFGDGIIQTGGVLETGSNTAMGTETYTFSSGELLGLANEAFTNQMALNGNIIFAAATGTTLTENASSWSFDATDGGSIHFGQGSNNGTILWHTNSGTITDIGNYSVEIGGCTFQAGNGEWGFVFSESDKTQIDSTGTLDMAAFSGAIENLQGSGSIIDTGGSSETLFIDGGGNFTGTISGAEALDLTSGTLVLRGNNTYAGGTTVESGAILQLGAGGGSGKVVGNITDDGTLIYDHSGALTVAATISGSGNVTYEGGTGVTVNVAQGYAGTTTVIGETASINNAAGMGNGTLDLQNAELIATQTMTTSLVHMTMEGTSTIAAAHGKTLTMGGASFSWELNGNPAPATLDIGDATNDGAVVWITGAGSTVSNLANCALAVNDGTFKAGDSSFSFLTGNASNVEVDTGAKMDFGSWGGQVNDLSGGGTVVCRAGQTLDLSGGNFAGVVSGACAVIIDQGMVLTGANTYSGGTTIDSDSALQLGTGGTTGSIVGNIVDNGIFIIARSDAIAETAAISGSGAFEVAGPGTVTMDHSQTYTGGTFIAGGELSIDRAAAISTGTLAIEGGEFLVTNNITITNTVTMSGNIIIAAATGDQVKFNASTGWYLDATAPSSITFGDGTNNGAIVWYTPAGSSINHVGNYTVDIHSAIVKAGDGSLGFLLDNASGVAIDSAGALNIEGFTTAAFNLTGSGIVTNTGAAADFIVEGGNFAGQLNGALSQVQLYDDTTLSDTGNFAGNFVLESGAQLDLAGVWTQGIDMAGTSTLVLHTPARYTGTISGFAAGDVIDLHGVNFNSPSFSETFNATTGVLTLGDGTHIEHAIFAGSYQLGNFGASSDGGTGTDIAFAAVAEAPSHPLDVQGPVLASDHPTDFG